MMPVNAYAQLGEAGIERLVERIYHWMAELPEAGAAMRLHHPDMSEVKRRLAAFLSGWLGGPDRFRPAYGEPFMRRRHMAFPIGNAERDAWMAAFRKALDEVVSDPGLHARLLGQFQAMADHLRNRVEAGDAQGRVSCGCQVA
jgi:hemoglobin